MNEKQKAFTRGIFAGKSAAQAYRDAGYKATGHSAEVNGSRLLKTAEVKAFLADLNKKVDRQAIMDRAWVLNKLGEVIDRCLQAVPVLNAAGQPSGTFTFNAAGAIRALELVGKERGMFVAKQDIDETIKIIADRPMTAEEWSEKYGGGMEPLKIGVTAAGPSNPRGASHVVEARDGGH